MKSLSLEYTQKIEQLQKEAEEIRNKQKEKEAITRNKLVEKMISLDFELISDEINCYDDDIYYLMFKNDDNIKITFYGNFALNKVFFYEVFYNNYSTFNNFEIQKFLVIQMEVNNILEDISEVRKIMHKEFPQLEDFSENFDKEYENFIDKRKN